MKQAVIYTRVSRDDTGEGRSNDRQEEACRKLADLRGWQIEQVEADISVSAFSGKDRPAWNRVLGLIELGQVDVVIAWHIDRMTRSMVDLENLIVLAEKHGVGIATVSGDIDLTSDVGRMVARILAAVARAEVERKSARQKLANEQRAIEGVPASGGVRPYGYAENRLDLVPTEAANVRQAAADALAGIPLSSIARRLGMTSRGVRFMLVSPRYVGTRMYNGVAVGKGLWPPILDQETHLALRAKLEDPNRSSGAVKRGRTPTTLLTGLATCGVCSRTITASSVRGRKTYSCRPGSHVHTDRSPADAWVGAKMIALLAESNAASLFLPDDDGELAEVMAETERLRARLAMLAEAFAEGQIEHEQLLAGSRRLRARLADAEEHLGMAAKPSEPISGLGTPAVRDWWVAAPLERQRAIVASLLDIKLHPRGPKREEVPIEVQVEVQKRKKAPAVAGEGYHEGESRSGGRLLVHPHDEVLTPASDGHDVGQFVGSEGGIFSL